MVPRRLATLLVLGAPLLLTCVHRRPAADGAAPTSGAPAATAATPPASAPAAEPSAPAADGSAPFDPTRVVAILDDPRLAEVRDAAQRELWSKAAQTLAEKLRTAATDRDRTAWRFQLGRLLALAGEPGAAAKSYDEAAADAAHPLRDHARLAAAQLYEKLDKHDEALSRARAIESKLGVALDVELVIAEALAGKGDVEGAAAKLRGWLGTTPRPGGWVAVTLRLGKLLVSRPGEEHAEEAATLARKVLSEAPGGAGAGDAKALFDAAVGALPFARRRRFEHPDGADLLARARGLVGAGNGREALRTTDALVAMPAAELGDRVCDAWIVRAEALGKLKRKAEAADTYGEAVARCQGNARRVDALYAGGRASASAGRAAEAMQRFATVEREFPKHALADDARLRGARAALELGDEARFTELLLRLPDDYPDGDVASDALFELALARIDKRDWSGALPVLERALARAPRERAYWARGRFGYYLGRARIETGAVDAGMAELAKVVKAFPLSFYMALAHARLSDRDPSAATRALEESVAAEPEGPFVVPPSRVFAEPAFGRAVELARQGEPRLARAELDQLGVAARTAPPELAWAAALVLARTGALREAHGLLRQATAYEPKTPPSQPDWVDHWPVGRWRAAWEAAYPRPFVDVVTREAQRSAIPDALAYAIMREESAFEPRVVSPAQAVGLMQLIVPTARKMAKPLGLRADAESLKRPEINVALGCRYLSVLRGQFQDNPLLAIPGYNAGGGAPRKWIDARPADDFDLWVERIPYEETRQYTKRVIGTLAAYEFLYGRGQPGEALRAPLSASPAARAGVASAALP